jgi:hypothetical protein
MGNHLGVHQNQSVQNAVIFQGFGGNNSCLEIANPVVAATQYTHAIRSAQPATPSLQFIVSHTVGVHVIGLGLLVGSETKSKQKKFFSLFLFLFYVSIKFFSIVLA